MKFILNLWQLPQNLIGQILVIYYSIKNKFEGTEAIEKIIINKKYSIPIYVYYFDDFKSGLSLGNIIILNSRYKPHYQTNEKSIGLLHELGHSVQSVYLGWLYLIVIGLPSLLNNILHDLFENTKLKWNYYSFYTENWANKIAKIK